MAGFNLSGIANPDDYNLGRGRVYFATLTNNIPGAFRFLGNAPEFSINVEVETLEHQASTNGLKVTDKEVIISQQLNLALTLDEINFENLALFFSGETATFTTAAGALAASTGTGNAEFPTAGRWYDIFWSSGDSEFKIGDQVDSTVGIEANRVYDIGDLDITGGTEGTDYITDNVMGRVFVPIGTGLSLASALDASGTENASADNTVEQVRGLTQTNVVGALKFISENPANNDVQRELNFHKTSLKAEGDFSLIGDEFTTMQFTAVAEKNETYSPDSPTVTVSTHDNAAAA